MNGSGTRTATTALRRKRPDGPATERSSGSLPLRQEPPSARVPRYSSAGSARERQTATSTVAASPSASGTATATALLRWKRSASPDADMSSGSFTVRQRPPSARVLRYRSAGSARERQTAASTVAATPSRALAGARAAPRAIKPASAARERLRTVVLLPGEGAQA